MSPLWLLPGLVLLVGGAGVIAALRSVTEEARQLRAELGRQRDVADAARRLARDLGALQSPLRHRR